jgi:hypothetical protein
MGHPRMAQRGITWKTCHMWDPRDHVCVMLSDCSLARCILTQVASTLSEMNDACFLLSSRTNSTFIMFTLAYEDDIDYFVSQ